MRGCCDFDMSEKEWLELVRKSKKTSTYHTSTNSKREREIERIVIDR